MSQILWSTILRSGLFGDHKSGVMNDDGVMVAVGFTQLLHVASLQTIQTEIADTLMRNVRKLHRLF